MKKLILVSTLVVSALVSGLAAATEQGKVISSTPVMRRVTEPGKAPEDRLIGYKVVYEYAGKQHTVQLPFAPGPTIDLDIQPAVSHAPTPSAPVAAPQPLYTPGEVYSTSPSYTQPVYTQPVYTQPATTVITQPVYVDPVYYPRTYYPAYSYDPFWPGLAIGVGLGYVWRGGCCWRGPVRVGGHWRR